MLMKTLTRRFDWLMVSALSALSGCGGGTPMNDPQQGLQAAPFNSTWHKKKHNGYEVERLVSDDKVLVPAEFEDPLLKNAWGLAASATSPWWVANNGTDTSTLYDGEGVKQALEVSLQASPTGLVFSGGDGFPITDLMNNTGPARFIFAGEDGTLQAWSPAVPPPAPSHFAFPVAKSPSEGAIYKGLAIAGTCGGARVYATDFHNIKVDVFDDQWALVELPCHAFIDPHLPPHYAPFGIRELDGKIFVTYALQDADAKDDVKGAGFGFVSAFDTDGNFLFRVASHGALNAPWGLAIAPHDFGKFSKRLLVGNFGDGRINAYDLSKCWWNGCKRVGELREPEGDPIEIDGLWALDFGKGNAMTGKTNSLYFTAGPNDEANGLFGYIEVAEEE
jgi:uncharacterized protein (TIGR03118 family)